MAGPMQCLQRMNTLSRVNITPIASASVGYAGVTAQARKLSEVEAVEAQRIGTGFAELDRVLGGGFVPGSVVLIGGDPGAGKVPTAAGVDCISPARGCYTSPAKSPSSSWHRELSVFSYSWNTSALPQKPARRLSRNWLNVSGPSCHS